MPIEIPTKEAIEAWNEWLAEPEREPVRAVAERFPPWELFRIPYTGQVVCVTSYAEDGTIKVYVIPEYNNEADFRTGCEVFGVLPADLEPWAPPFDA